jgi:hypothetical protein
VRDEKEKGGGTGWRYGLNFFQSTAVAEFPMVELLTVLLCIGCCGLGRHFWVRVIWGGLGANVKPACKRTVSKYNRTSLTV